MSVKQEFRDYLEQRGYDVDRMYAKEWDESGYFELVVDSQGRRLDEVRNWRQWHGPLDYGWLVENWHDRFEKRDDDEARS